MMRPTPDILAQAGQGDVDAMTAAMGPQVMALDISAVRLDGGTQPRAGINQAVVEDYASDMEANGAEFPPVQVVYDGADYWLWDGFHRLHARKRNGLHTVSAIVRQGTRRDAVLLSVGANAAHGLRRTGEDKRRAVETLLRDPEWAEWSDREIGRRVGVDGKTVAAHRARLSAEIPQIETRRVERQGTEYGMKQPQRPAAAAVGAQGSKYMTLVEMTAAIEDWSKSFETQREALDGLRIDWGNGGGSYLEDWEDVAPAEWQAHDLLAAIRLVREGLERAQDAALPSAAKPLVPWEMMVLVEELVALEGVALDGVDEDWLFGYMTDRARSKGHTFTRAIFDMAMKLAIQRQLHDNQRMEMLANAQAAAVQADAQRREQPASAPATSEAQKQPQDLMELLQMWAEATGESEAWRGILADMLMPGFPYTHNSRWQSWKAWLRENHPNASQPGIIYLRETLRVMDQTRPKPDLSEEQQARSETGPSEPQQAWSETTLSMVFDRRDMLRGQVVKIYGRNAKQGTLTVTVDREKVHLYSPGLNLSIADMNRLTEAIGNAIAHVCPALSDRVQASYAEEMLSDSDGAARHWAHGEFEIVVRSLQDEEQVVVLDRSVIAAVNRLLRAQPALPMPGYEPPDEAAQVVVAAGEAWPAETGCYEYPILGSSVGSSGGAM